MLASGIHNHPIPLPSKTPPFIRETVFKLLRNLGEDLPDITPRRFLRHPTIKSFLRDRFPDNHLPTLSHLHISLANKDHLKAYINQVKLDSFPQGTGWEGLVLSCPFCLKVTSIF
jgi:hypothetical protein